MCYVLFWDPRNTAMKNIHKNPCPNKEGKKEKVGVSVTLWTQKGKFHISNWLAGKAFLGEQEVSKDLKRDRESMGKKVPEEDMASAKVLRQGLTQHVWAISSRPGASEGEQANELRCQFKGMGAGPWKSELGFYSEW